MRASSGGLPPDDARPPEPHTIPAVEAGWAVYGKEAGSSDDYAVLRSAPVHFSRRAYQDILQRFTPGTPPLRSARRVADSLPWATVSYAPLRRPPGPGGGRPQDGEGSSQSTAGVLGMAVCDWTDIVDSTGRPVAETTYVCAPFDALAAGAVTYEALLDAVRSDSLAAAAAAPGGGGEPDGEPAGRVVLELPGGPSPTQIAAELVAEPGRFRLAAGIAALALCQPVALLGAPPTGELAGMAERLHFLDLVAALLPYGQRALLAVSTWADSGTAHQARVAFTERARTGDAAVRLAGPAGPAALPAMPFPAADYFHLLVGLRERQLVPLEQIVAHLRKPAYRVAHAVADPRHALLCLADLAGVAFFASPQLTSAKARTFVEQAAVATSKEEKDGLRRRAVLEEAAVTVDLLRTQHARGHLLAGPKSSEEDVRLREVLAGRRDARLLALELVRLAIEDDLRAAMARPVASAHTEQTAHTVAWLVWMAPAPELADKVRWFAEILDRQVGETAFGELRRLSPWGDTRFALSLMRLARLVGRAGPLYPVVSRWLVGVAADGRLTDADQRGWADEVATWPAGKAADQAKLDIIRLLLGAGPVQPLRARMTDPSWREYANSLYEAYHRLVIRPGSSRLDLTIAERIMEGLAASLARAGWPDEEGVAEDTLGLLYRFVMLTYRLPDGMRAAVDEFLGRNPRPRLHRQTRERWRGALATLA